MCIAPGTVSMMMLSTIVIVRIETVSAASTRRNAFLNEAPALTIGRVDTLYPEINERIAASSTVSREAKLNVVPIVTPMSSPIAQPIRQCSVALAAIFLMEPRDWCWRAWCSFIYCIVVHLMLDINILSGIFITMRKRSEQFRQQIIQAAHDLFLRDGYVGTSVDAIATQANVTKRTIYGYFPDKRALFAGVIEDAVGEPLEFHIPLEGIVTIEGLQSALYAVAHGLNEIVMRPDYVQLLRVTIAEVNSQPDLETLFEQGATRRSLRVVTGLLKTANLHGITTIKHPEVAARMFVGGFTVQALLDGLLHATNTDVHKLTKSQLTDYVDEFISHIAANGEAKH